MDNFQKQVKISKETDVVKASLKAMEAAELIGFDKISCYAISTAVSELARNIFKYAHHGTISFESIKMGDNQGILIIAEDNGPGIDDISKALKDNFSTADSLGLGLPGVKRLMDEFNIESERNYGTKITVKKWV